MNEKEITKTKLKIRIGSAVFGACVGLFFAREYDITTKLFSVATWSILSYEVGELASDCYHLNRI